jgi:hypothetical protein
MPVILREQLTVLKQMHLIRIIICKINYTT